eukprot:jgi/Bigna1/137270/aug1.38_g11978
MIDAPKNLAQDWYVASRPEGIRCLVVSGGGKTTAFAEHGGHMASFRTVLPGGGSSSRKREEDGDDSGSDSDWNKGRSDLHQSCVCDCVRYVDQEGRSVLYVADVMVWCGYSLYDTDFEFRNYWLHQKLQSPELSGDFPPPPPATKISNISSDAAEKRTLAHVPIRLLHWGKASGTQVWQCYADGPGYIKDGLIFAHRQCAYLPGEPSPLLLRWKDQRCSRYPIDTLKNGTALPTQRALLRVLHDGVSLGTSDIPPVVVGFLNYALRQQRNRSGSLVQAEIGPGGMWVAASDQQQPQQNQQQQQQPRQQQPGSVVLRGYKGISGGNGETGIVGADLARMRILPSYREPFTLSRMLFQYLARQNPVTIGMVIEATRKDSRGLAPPPPGTSISAEGNGASHSHTQIANFNSDGVRSHYHPPPDEVPAGERVMDIDDLKYDLMNTV